MLGDFLKALELLLSAVRKTPDKKREDLAKELLGIYLDTRALVSRGKHILSLLRDTHTPVHRGISITLLTEQQQLLQSLSNRLSTGMVHDLLSLHLPDAAESLVCLFERKGRRVFFMLDQLVSDGKPLSPDEWVSNLEARMPVDVPLEYRRRFDPISLEASLERVRPPLPDEELLGFYIRPSRFLVFANEAEVDRGHDLLNRIALAGEELRCFLIEKFQLEDVL